VGLGSRVRRFSLGDEVYAYSFLNPKGGFYAEYVAVHSEKVARIPKSLDLEHAGAIPTTGLTALQGIEDVIHLHKGESIIVHGATERLSPQRSGQGSPASRQHHVLGKIVLRVAA
jgi:NADPH:quinone reductase-like Zn-dependent oxidoreductase